MCTDLCFKCAPKSYNKRVVGEGQYVPLSINLVLQRAGIYIHIVDENRKVGTGILYIYNVMYACIRPYYNTGQLKVMYDCDLFSLCFASRHGSHVHDR